MLLDPNDLRHNFNRLEEIEKASLRLVVQAIYDFRHEAIAIFDQENDLVADIGEDITREALDRMGVSRINKRLFGKIDYKRARYIFHAEYAVKQALFVDSKAEKISGAGTATLQTSQFSLVIHQERSGQIIAEPGDLPVVLDFDNDSFITTTIFVKYNYDQEEGSNKLKSITIVALPNGILQERYNPSYSDGIWLAGRNAPSRGEAFRVRLSFAKLSRKCRWRVQTLVPTANTFTWEE